MPSWRLLAGSLLSAASAETSGTCLLAVSREDAGSFFCGAVGEGVPEDHLKQQREACEGQASPAEYALVLFRLSRYVERHLGEGGWMARARGLLGVRPGQGLEHLDHHLGVCVPRGCSGVEGAAAPHALRWMVRFCAATALQLPPEALPPIGVGDAVLRRCCSGVRGQRPLLLRVAPALSQLSRAGAVSREVALQVLGTVGVNTIGIQQDGLACLQQFLRDGDRGGLNSYSESSSDPSSVATRELYVRCRASGGELWAAALRQEAAPAWEDGTSSMRICAPPSCPARVVRDVLVPLDLPAAAGRPYARAAVVSLERLGRWEDLDLDFALVAFPKCGTTSLGQFLARYAAQVSRDSAGAPLSKRPGRCSPTSTGGCSVEDHFFHRVHHSRLADALPESQLRAFNDRSSDGSPLERTVGVVWRFVQETPVVAYDRGSLEVLALIPALRVVAIVRDPVEQFVSLYGNIVSGVGPGPVDLPALPQVVADTERYRSGQEVPEPFNRFLHHDGGRFAGPLRTLRELFGERLHLLHLEELSGRPRRSRAAAVRLLRFLQLGGPNASSLPQLPEANRRHSLSLLCGPGPESAALRSRLVSLLSEEYAALYHAPGAPFAHLKHRGPCAQAWENGI